MRRIIKPAIWFALAFIVLNAVIAAYFMIHSLKTRFPRVNFAKAHLGRASWYSKTDKGVTKLTANGETFNDRAMTCASWNYPFNTHVLVINPLNGKWVVCRVNDRGPAKRLHLQLDLTKAAYKKIANPKSGRVHIAYLAVRKPPPKKKA